MAETSYMLAVNAINVLVTHKSIKNFHIYVYPPSGDVRVSAPMWMDKARIAEHVYAKMTWILRKREFFQALEEPCLPKFQNMETHYVWGEPCELRIYEGAPRNRVCCEAGRLEVYTSGKAEPLKIGALLQEWFRASVYAEARERIACWRKIMGLGEIELCVRKMKSRWGTCYPRKGKIALNSELGKKPQQCLNYVVAHEMAHFFVPNHGKDFKRLMDKYLPDWQGVRQLLNSFPN